MSHMLHINQSPSQDDSIVGIQLHTYNPYTTSFNNSDEIRIAIQQQDIYTLPHESYIYIEGTFSQKATVTAGTTDSSANEPQLPDIINNGISHLFDEIRYELNGFEIDKCKNVGITSTLKGLVSHNVNDINHLQNSGWNLFNNITENRTKLGSFSYCLPLKNFLGFAEDYRSIIINSKQELILIRSRKDTNIFFGTIDNVEVNLSKIQWRIPHVKVSDSVKLSLLKYVEKQSPIHLCSRSWDLYEYPSLPRSTKNIWSVKTTSYVNKPRYIIIGFRTNKNNQIASNSGLFDHCQLRNLRVYLNSECYPYENMSLDFNENKFSTLYHMYSKFQQSFYHDQTCSSPLLNVRNFKDIAPLVVIDCSRQEESYKKSVVDIRIEIETNQAIPASTTAYCLIIHDNLITYNPYTNIVNRAI